jgi:hypothetical protein
MSALKAIHVARRQLGLDDDDYRAVLERVTGKRSSAEMTEAERRQVVEELRRLGFASAPAGRQPLSGPYAKKLQALWLSAWNLGIVRNRDDKALIAFVERQTGISHVRWLREPGDAAKAIEALKSWMTREAGVVWPRSRGALESKRAVLAAQDRMLRAEAGPEPADAGPVDEATLDAVIAAQGDAIRLAIRAKTKATP